MNKNSRGGAGARCCVAPHPETGEPTRYESCAKAGKAHGVTPMTVIHRIQSGWEGWSYDDEGLGRERGALISPTDCLVRKVDDDDPRRWM